MGRHVTFIHAADLHLGAPFRGLRNLSEAWAERLCTAIVEAFDRLIEQAIERRVDFVVIAGDVFDTSRSSYGDYLHFFDGLAALGRAGIPVYLCTGNHDPYTSWQKDFADLPPNATMFAADRPSFAAFEREGRPLCLLGGRSYYHQTWPADCNIAEGISRPQAELFTGVQAPFMVGVIHTGLDLDPVKAPVSPQYLMAADVDYWACGHIHSRYAYPSLDDPRIVFSGCIQGRDIKETGPRGCYLVELSEDAPNRIEEIPTASVVWEQVSVEVGECATVADVEKRVVRALYRANGAAQCDDMVARVTLSGETALHEVLRRPDVLRDLRARLNDALPSFFCDALVDATRTPRDRDKLVAEGLFPAVVLRASRSSEDPADLAYLQEEFLARGLAFPSALEKALPELSAEAESLVLDLLEGEAGL